MIRSNQLVSHLNDITLNNLRNFSMKFLRSKVVLELERDDGEMGILKIWKR